MLALSSHLLSTNEIVGVTLFRLHGVLITFHEPTPKDHQHGKLAFARLLAKASPHLMAEGNQASGWMWLEQSVLSGGALPNNNLL